MKCIYYLVKALTFFQIISIQKDILISQKLVSRLKVKTFDLMKVDTRLHWKTGQKTLFQNYLNILWGIELHYIET